MDVPALERWLLGVRSADGSWGYAPDTPGVPEATLHAVAAGLPAPIDWLRGRDLGWGTWFLPAALRHVTAAADIVQAAVGATLDAHGRAVEKPVGDFDGTILGWTWIPDTFSWVEPTAWAVVGLCAAGHGDHVRVADGRALLRDRQGTDGGWNYGNPNVLGAELDAYPHTTALVLLALPPGPEADRAWRYLEHAIADMPSALNLSLGALAAAAHGRDATVWKQDLSARQRPDGSVSGRCHVDALALLACRDAPHAYAIHGGPRG